MSLRTVTELCAIVDRKRQRLEGELAQLRSNRMTSRALEEELDLCDVLDFLLRDAKGVKGR